MDRLGEATATAILGIDTLWGGDVMNQATVPIPNSNIGTGIAESIRMWSER